MIYILLFMEWLDKRKAKKEAARRTLLREQNKEKFQASIEEWLTRNENAFKGITPHQMKIPEGYTFQEVMLAALETERFANFKPKL